MSLNFACITPHPPLLIPEIGKEDTIKVSQTIAAMNKLANLLNQAELDTLIFISPHGLVYPDRFNISVMKKSFGTFAQFDAPEITFEYSNDMDLVEEIVRQAKIDSIPLAPYDNNGEFYELDHGIMMPLYYLRQEQETSLKIVPVSYSWLDRASHFSFGQMLGTLARKSPDRIGIVASGDLSHRLLYGTPSDNPEAGKKFDQKIIEDLTENKLKDIVLYEEDFVENAGECAYRSILILLGALDSMNEVLSYEPQVLSYEGPFGVGYGVVNFKLPETN